MYVTPHIHGIKNMSTIWLDSVSGDPGIKIKLISVLGLDNVTIVIGYITSLQKENKKVKLTTITRWKLIVDDSLLQPSLVSLISTENENTMTIVLNLLASNVLPL